jgi:putative membrane protein
MAPAVSERRGAGQPDPAGSRAEARKRKWLGPSLWLLGLTVAIALVARQGFAEVAASVAAAGWGVLWLGLVHLLPMTADTLGWRALLRRQAAAGFATLFWARWIGQSVNNLLPSARVGGEFLRAWLISRKTGIPGAAAGASVIVDLTATFAAQLVYTLAGVALLVARGAGGDLLSAAAIGLGVLLAMLASFLLAQRFGVIAVLERLTGALLRHFGWSPAAAGADSLQARVEEAYRRRGPLLACGLLHLLGWVLGALEVWLALWLLGHPVTLLDALIIESLIQAVRSAAFFMPGALGAQEGGLILLGALFGIAPATALALSLLLRIRELLIGLPGLLAWHLHALYGQFAPESRSRGG